MFFILDYYFLGYSIIHSSQLRLCSNNSFHLIYTGSSYLLLLMHLIICCLLSFIRIFNLGILIYFVVKINFIGLHISLRCLSLRLHEGWRVSRDVSRLLRELVKLGTHFISGDALRARNTYSALGAKLGHQTRWKYRFLQCQMIGSRAMHHWLLNKVKFGKVHVMYNVCQIKPVLVTAHLNCYSSIFFFQLFFPFRLFFVFELMKN
jgi:hypothetical protein